MHELKRHHFFTDFYLYIVFALYFATGISLLFFLGYYTDSPDTVFYLTISGKYAEGNFTRAINNYWSPLISWLLVPFQLFHADPLLSFKILQLFIGAVGIFLAIDIASFFVKENFVKKLFAFCLVLVFLSWSLLYQTPDLLFLVLLLALIYFLIKSGFHETVVEKDGTTYFKRNQLIKSMIIGLIGAFLYFSKSYGFPFFIAGYTLYMSFCFFYASNQKTRKNLLKNYITCLAVFIGISTVWILCLHQKYGTISTGYASVYNFNLLAPGIYKPGSTILQHPVLENGLMDISSREEASAWESPGSFKQASWSPFSNNENFIHYIHIIKSNWLSFYYFIITRNIGVLFILSWIFFFVLVKKTFSKISKHLKWICILLFIYVAGYSLVFFMPRYLWLCYILMPVIIFNIWEIIYFEKRNLKWMYYGMVCLTCLLLVKKPVKELLFKEDVAMPVNKILAGIGNPLSTLRNSYIVSMQIPSLIDKLKTSGLHSERIAGVVNNDPAHFSYTQSLVLCMYLNQAFYGELPLTTPEQEKINQLRKFNIQYIYSWDANARISDGEKVMFEDRDAGFKVIKIYE